MTCTIDDFMDLAHQLPEVTRRDLTSWSAFAACGNTFGYLWPRTSTVGLKQTITEQRALVAERPDVFEVQYTSGGFGWVVVSLDRIDRDELAELTFEAWRLTVPSALVEARGDDLPT